MNKKKIIILGIIVLTVVIISVASFALWQITLKQESTNVITTGCLKLSFIDQEEIQLQNTYPLSEEAAHNLNPYIFAIENICNISASYQINLEELALDTKRLPDTYIKMSLDQKKGKKLSILEQVDPIIEGADISHKLTTGILKNGEKKEFALRLWLDENTPVIEEAMNATFKSKVSITAVQKENIPEVSLEIKEYFDGIKIDVTTISNNPNDTFKYFYQLEEKEEIESTDSSFTFTNLKDGKYRVRVRVETEDGIILEEREEIISVAYEKVYISESGNDETGNGAIDNPYATLQPAYNKVKSGGDMLLLSDITATSTTNMNIENKEVTLKSNGENIYTVIKDLSFTTQILDIRNSNTITTMNITFDGNEVVSSASLLEVHDSTLNLNEGTTVQKNNNCGRNYEEGNNAFGALGGGLFVWQSTLNINGANILNNKTSVQSGIWSQGGGLFINKSNFNLNNGNISYNENVGAIENQLGGGIAFQNGTFTMNGGTISNNKTPKQGGGMIINSVGMETIMVMNGGTIENNVVTGDVSWYNGGGISAIVDSESNGKTLVYIKGGTIANNTAPTAANTYARNGAQIVDQRY